MFCTTPTKGEITKKNALDWKYILIYKGKDRVGKIPEIRKILSPTSSLQLLWGIKSKS